MLPDGTASIPLRGRDGSVRAHALVDQADLEWAAQFRWWLTTGGYAERGWRSTAITMHRDLVGLKRGDTLQVDHINRNRLDNRRANLRLTTPQGNAQNQGAHGGSSGFRGVTWHRGAGKWMAQAAVARTNHYLGLFDSELNAARVASDFRRDHMAFAVEGDLLPIRSDDSGEAA